MSREEMVKRPFKPYMTIIYKPARVEYGIEMLLTGINFDDEIMTLQPLCPDYVQQEYITAIQNCHFPKKGLKVVGKKEYDNSKVEKEITDETGTFLPGA